MKKVWYVMAVALVGLLSFVLNHSSKPIIGGTENATYFARVDGNGVVQEVIVASPQFIASGAEGDPTKWVQTSMDGTVGGPNYAGVGNKYDSIKNTFVPSKPAAILNTQVFVSSTSTPS